MLTRFDHTDIKNPCSVQQNSIKKIFSHRLLATIDLDRMLAIIQTM